MGKKGSARFRWERELKKWEEREWRRREGEMGEKRGQKYETMEGVGKKSNGMGQWKVQDRWRERLENEGMWKNEERNKRRVHRVYLVTGSSDLRIWYYFLSPAPPPPVAQTARAHVINTDNIISHCLLE